MDTSIIGPKEYPQFKDRQQSRLERNDLKMKKIREESEKIHNEIDSVEERLAREQRERLEAEREQEQLDELRRADDRYAERRRNRYRK